jgi:hypothetical protein
MEQEKQPFTGTGSPSDSADSGPRRRRRIFGRIGYAVFLILIVEGSLQLFYRATAGDWLFRRIPLPIYAPDAYRGWSVQSNLRFHHTTNEFSVDYITNSQGFRTNDPERIYARPKPSGVYRILLMGPSFAFGWANSYADTLGARLEQRLTNTEGLGGRRVEVINAGVPSLGWPAQQRWFEHVGRTYEPDLLILIHYGDMISDAAFDNAATYRVNEEGYLVTADSPRWRRFSTKAKQSAILFYGYVACQRITEALRNRSTSPAEQPEPSAPAIAGFNPNGKRAIAIRQKLESFRNLAASEGARTILVHVPLGYTLQRQGSKPQDTLSERQNRDSFDIDAATCRYLQETTGALCLDLGIPFQQQPVQNRERMYYRLDPHFTPLGNRIAAEVIAEAIRESLRIK